MMFEEYGVGELEGVISRQRALELIFEVRNTALTIFAPDHWPKPRVEKLQSLLCDPLTSEQSQALLAAILRRCSLNDTIAWLEDGTTGWQSFLTQKRWLKEQQEEEARRLEKAEIEQMVEEDEERLRRSGFATFWEWLMNDQQFQAQHKPRLGAAKSRHLSKAKPCTNCHADPATLTWFYFCSPPSAWRQLIGRAGWMTCCPPCGIPVDFFVEMMN